MSALNTGPVSFPVCNVRSSIKAVEDVVPQADFMLTGRGGTQTCLRLIPTAFYSTAPCPVTRRVLAPGRTCDVEVPPS